MIGHNNSNCHWWYKRVCEVQTRYNEESVTIYSHSVVTFYHEGKQYKTQIPEINQLSNLSGELRWDLETTLQNQNVGGSSPAGQAQLLRK